MKFFMMRFKVTILLTLFIPLVFFSCDSSNDYEESGLPIVPRPPADIYSLFYFIWHTPWEELEIYRSEGNVDKKILNSYYFHIDHYTHEYRLVKNGQVVENIVLGVPDEITKFFSIIHEPDQREIVAYDFTTWKSGGTAVFQVLEIDEEAGSSSVITYSEPIGSMSPVTLPIYEGYFLESSFDFDQYINSQNQQRIKYLGKISDKYGRIPIIYTGKEQPDEVILLSIGDMSQLVYKHPQYDELTKDLAFTTD